MRRTNQFDGCLVIHVMRDFVSAAGKLANTKLTYCHANGKKQSPYGSFAKTRSVPFLTMEPHRELSGTEDYKPNFADGPQAYFDMAMKFTRQFYSSEMDQIASVDFSQVSPEYFTREHCWVVHATGFSARAVGKFMPRLLLAYGDWTTLGREQFEDAFCRVKLVCNNPMKAKAVHAVAARMCDELLEKEIEWPEFRHRCLSSPAKLKELPHIGPITCYHLARNIGLLEFVKPDLHLVRMAKYWGFEDCVEMCKSVRPEGLALGLVDLVLWYFASHTGTLSIRAPGER